MAERGTGNGLLGRSRRARPCGTTTATTTQSGGGMAIATSTFELNQATRGFVEDCLLRSPRKDLVRLALQASLYLPDGQLVGTSAKSANLHVGQMFPFTVWNDRSAWLDELAERVALAMLGTPFITALLEYWLNSTELVARWAAGGAFLDWFLSVHFAFFSWLGCGAAGSGSLGVGLLVVLLVNVLRRRASSV